MTTLSVEPNSMHQAVWKSTVAIFEPTVRITRQPSDHAGAVDDDVARDDRELRNVLSETRKKYRTLYGPQPGQDARPVGPEDPQDI